MSERHVKWDKVVNQYNRRSNTFNSTTVDDFQSKNVVATSKSLLTDRCYWRYTDSKRLLRCVNDLWNGTKWSDKYEQTF